MAADFCHLRVRSYYTLMDGVAGPKTIVSKVKDRGQKHVAVTDAGNLCAAIELHGAAKAKGIHAVHGVELWTYPRGLEAIPRDRADAPDDQGWHLALLVMNEEGWRNACQLVTTAIRNVHYRPRIDLPLLRRHAKGLFCLTGGRFGPIGRHPVEEATAIVTELADVFGQDRIAVELQDHGLRHEEGLVHRARTVAARLGLPRVATNDVRYVDPFDAPLLDVLNANAIGRPVHGLNDLGADTDQLYLKTAEEMAAVGFSEDELAMSVRIAERCDFSLRTGTNHFPQSDPPPEAPPEERWRWLVEHFPPPKAFGEVRDVTVEGWTDTERYFLQYARRGLDLRLEHVSEGEHPTYRARLEDEAALIRKMGFPAYMLIVAEFINWSKDNGIPIGPGRGSAAGSLVAFAMRITDVDPIRYNLLFERFLNPARVSMPDIDVDFCQERREEAIQHVRDRYGEECVGQIMTFGAIKAKAAFKSVARALQIHFMDANEISAWIGDAKNLVEAEADPRIRPLVQGSPTYRNVYSMAKALEGTPVQTGAHAAGVVIASQPLVSFLPIHRVVEKDGDTVHVRDVVGTDMKGAETIGLIKFDFLGLKTLDVIRLALDYVEARHGTRPDMAEIPVDDVAVYELLARGDTLGVFQVESHGMRDLLRRLKPDGIEDVIALLALYRPGPLSSGMVDDFVERKHGRKVVEYPYPTLEPVIRQTYGVMVYQEQIMQVAQVLAGYSLAEADLLRRAMGKKKPEEMAAQKGKFLEGAKANGVPEATAVKIFELIDYFSGYGFNRCLSGSTIVLRAGANAHSGPEVTIRDLYLAQGTNTPYGKKLRAGRVHLLQMHDDGRIRPGRLVRIHYNGTRPVFVVRTASGRSIRATGNHRLLTDAGYLTVDEIRGRPGTKLLVMGKDPEEGVGHHTERAAGKGYGPRKGVPSGAENPAWIDGRHVALETARRIVRERAGGKCEACGAEPGQRKHGLEFAHQKTLEECGGDFTRFNSAENLEHLCNPCHKRLDYQKGERRPRWSKGRPTELDDVVSVEPDGEEEVFDPEMADPCHNFVANGIVSHNSHSAAYGLITYQTAWLKTRYRAEFMASVLTWEAGNHAQVASLALDCRRAGIDIVGPDVNLSSRAFTVFDVEDAPAKPSIRFGLGAVKGVGARALEVLSEARAAGPFLDFLDFLSRVDGRVVNKQVVEALACAGAFDSLGVDRQEAMRLAHEHREAVKALATAEKNAKAKVPGNQLGLFGVLPAAKPGIVKKKPKNAAKQTGKQSEIVGGDLFGGEPLESKSPEPSKSTTAETATAKEEEKDEPVWAKPWTFTERMAREARVLGLWLTGHPLDRYVDVERVSRCMTIEDLPRLRAGMSASVMGVIVKVHKIPTKRGDTMGFLAVMDRTMETEVTLFPNVWKTVEKRVSAGVCVHVIGRVDRDGNDGKLIVEEIETLDGIRSRLATTVDVHLEVPQDTGDDARIDALRSILEAHPGTVPTRLLCTKPGRWTTTPMRMPFTVDPTPEFFAAVEGLLMRPCSVTLPMATWTTPPYDGPEDDGDTILDPSRTEDVTGGQDGYQDDGMDTVR
jgi:DNA polymerase-3 subunit alpha